jgi:CxxC motif-containing protein
MTTFTCIVCPKGCRLRIDEKMTVSGNGCERGAVYAVKELTNPTRVTTSTVRIRGAAYTRLPVKTDRDIPKSAVRNAVRLLDRVTVDAPVKCGDIILSNILDTGANFVATRTLPRQGA